MDTPRITVRPAKIDDAATVALAVALAIGDQGALQAYCGQNYLSVLTEIARREQTQYSWQNALIAEVNGVTAGAIVGYDGAQLGQLREGTFACLREMVGSVPNIDDETQDGEYYLDSIGIWPEFRGLGVGRVLITALCHKAFSKEIKRVGLIVDYDNPQSERLYSSLGFQRVGTKLFLGHNMWHLQKEADLSDIVRCSNKITPFQKKVYLELLNIPAGTTISYGKLAQRIGCRSAQAVGQALKRNPFAPQVPCHRVIAADGSLGGYNGMREGEHIAHKRKLLEEEK